MIHEIEALVAQHGLLVSACSFIGGALLTGVLGYLRGRVRELEYTVSHDRIGLSADDRIFGNVRVTWQGVELTNLYSSTVTIENHTPGHLENIRFKAITDKTLLLSQFTQIPGTAYIVKYSPEYEAVLHVSAGAEPSASQLETYRHDREYLIPVLNRGGKAVLKFLTTDPTASGPAVWLDLQHAGLRMVYRANEPMVHGVPVRYAVRVGLVAALATAVAVGVYVPNVWLSVALSMTVGLFAQLVGAGLFKAWRFLWRLAVG